MKRSADEVGRALLELHDAERLQAGFYPNQIMKAAKLDLDLVTGADGRVDESFITFETREQMQIFNGKYPADAVAPNTPLPAVKATTDE